MGSSDTPLINLEKYPINERSSSRFKPILRQVHAELAKDGCAVLKGFIGAEGVRALAWEANQTAAFAHKSHSRTNAYFTKDDPELPGDHPARRFFERSNAFVPADNFPADGPLRRIYDFDGFDGFIQACLQQHPFHRYADPLADVIINMADQGNGFPWHYDTNNFTVTISIQNALSGGAFEYVPDLRKGTEDFAEVNRVLDGVSDKVCTLHLEPGDLQIFKGRYALHRVTPLTGDRPRFVAIFSYVDQPDMVATPERCLQLYGRALPIHYERAGQRADSFLD